MSTQLEIKDYYSPDIDEIWSWKPKSSEDVNFLLEVNIGEYGEDASDIFQVTITTATKAYQRIQNAGFDVRLVDDILGDAGTTSVRGYAEVNKQLNGSLNDAVSTLVHESKHVDLFKNTGNLYGTRGTRKGEYGARAREFLFQNGRRPSATERQAIKNEIIDLGY